MNELETGPFLELRGVAGEVLLHHQGHLEDDGVLELPQVQAGDFLDFLQAVDQGVPVDEQLAGRLGDVQAVLEEALDGEQRLVVQGIDGALAEHLLEEHLAQGGGQLVNQAGNAQVVVADDGLLGVEDLSHFQGHLGLFEGAGQILNAVDHRADTHSTVGVELAGEGVHNGTGQLVDVFLIDVGLNLLDQGDVRLVDIDDEVLVLIGEQVLEHIVGGDVVLLGNLHQHAHPADVRIEMELVALEIDVTGQDVIQDDVFDKVAPVVLLVVILLDAVEGHGQDFDIFLGLRVLAGHKHGVLRAGTAAEGLEAVFIRLEHVYRSHLLWRDFLADLPNLPQLAAGDDYGGLIHNADGTVDGITHLVDDTLKQSV